MLIIGGWGRGNPKNFTQQGIADIVKAVRAVVTGIAQTEKAVARVDQIHAPIDMEFELELELEGDQPRFVDELFVVALDWGCTAAHGGGGGGGAAHGEAGGAVVGREGLGVEGAVDAGDAVAVGENDAGGGGTREIELLERWIGDDVSEGGADGTAPDYGHRRELEHDLAQYVNWHLQDVKLKP